MKTMHVRLRYARIDAGYESASAAAKAHGWPISTLTAHENGQNDYNAQQAEVYAKAFKTTAEWLMFGKTPSPPPGSDQGPGIDAQLLQLPKEQSDALIKAFNTMIETTRIIGKAK